MHGSPRRCLLIDESRALVGDIVGQSSRFCSMARRPVVLLGLLLALAGCGGGLALLHPAHVLPPGEVRGGVGLSGQLALLPSAPSTSPETNERTTIEEASVAPALAPWVSARIGIAGDNEAGLTYSGRAIRLDGRHAFSLGGPTLSLGLGASAVRPSLGPSSGLGGVFGGGFDVPVLFGLKSDSDLYSIWAGPRAGIDFLGGALSARHVFAGLVAGLKVGFRHIHVAIEIDGDYHRVDGSIGKIAVGLNQVTLTPAGALLISF